MEILDSFTYVIIELISGIYKTNFSDHLDLFDDSLISLGVTFFNDSNLLNILHEKKPDVIFIEINKKNAVFYRNIRDLFTESEIILYSYVLPDMKTYQIALDIGVIDLIIYPFNNKKLQSAIHKAKRNARNKKMLKKLEVILQKDYNHIICYKKNYRDYHISENNILYIEKVSKRFIKIFLIDGTVIESSSILEEIKMQASQNLFSPHRSFIVNMKYMDCITVDKFIHGNYIVKMSGSSVEIPVSKKGYQQYKEQYLLNENVKRVR